MAEHICLLSKEIVRLTYGSIYYTNMTDPYTSGHITDANIIAGTSAQPQIEKMAEQICLLSKEVVRLRGQLMVHPQLAHDVPTHILPPQPQRTPVTRRHLNYVEGYG
jgi:proline racemase